MSKPRLRIVSKAKWYGDPARGDIEPLKRPVSNVFWVLNTYSFPCNQKFECQALMRSLQSRHQLVSFLPDIRYNFVVAKTCHVFEGRGWTKRPDLPERLAHYNHDAMYIAFLGPGHASYITPDMKQTLEQLIILGIRKGHINKRYSLHTSTRFEEPMTTPITSIYQ